MFKSYLNVFKVSNSNETIHSTICQLPECMEEDKIKKLEETCDAQKE